MFVISDFVSNLELCCFCILLLDVFGLMNGRFINEFNVGLVIFCDELFVDLLVLKRVELGIVMFGLVYVE